MEDKKEVMFYGYSDGKAMHIYNLLSLFIPTSITVIIAIILSILSLVIKEYYIMFVWITPLILFRKKYVILKKIKNFLGISFSMVKHSNEFCIETGFWKTGNKF